MFSNKVKYFYTLILLLFFCQFNFGQTKIDSLKSVLKRISTQKGYATDTVRFNLLLAIGNVYQILDQDSAIRYDNLAENIAIQLKDEVRQNEALAQKGWCEFENGNYIEALMFFKRALTLVQKQALNQDKAMLLKIKTEQSNILMAIGYTYFHRGEYPKALDHFFKTLKLHEELKNEKGRQNSLGNIGAVHMRLRDRKKALKYFLMALKIAEERGDKNSQAINLSNIGLTYTENDNQKALAYHLKSLKLSEELGNKSQQASCLANIGNVYEEIHDPETANSYYLRALKIDEEIGNKTDQIITLHDLGTLYTSQKKYDLARNYLKQAFDLAMELGSLDDIKQAHEDLSRLYQETKQTDKALYHFKQFIVYRDSLFNEENTKTLIQKEMQYNYDKKATSDSLSNAKEQEVKEAKHQAEMEIKRNEQYALFAGLALLFVFAGFMYNRFKVTQKQKIIIEDQKRIVDKSQEKIISSINYAKKIQHSILPSFEEIQICFPEHFVFFKPKDIVSGDFYWFHHQNDLSFFACADCTGHGVPGAFMTMIAHSNLIEVVVEQKVTDPGKILSGLHQLIFKNLQQHKGDEYSQDGLDISLAVVDHKTNLLHFSAARNNGYLVSEKTIQILKATPRSIGGLSMLGEIEPERIFKTETIKLKAGSYLVLTTDGMLDQMNPQDEKFGLARFKDLLLNLEENDSVINLNKIESVYSEWKDNSQQLDDILVVGIKVC